MNWNYRDWQASEIDEKKEKKTFKLYWGTARKHTPYMYAYIVIDDDTRTSRKRIIMKVVQ